MFFQKGIQENTCASLFFNKVADLRPATLLKKETSTGVSQIDIITTCLKAKLVLNP